jgi:hypothetical protein
MKKKIIKRNCKSIFDGRISREMIDSVEVMFDKFMLNKESNRLENDLSVFFDEVTNIKKYWDVNDIK